jgi:cytidine deaminase
MTQSLRAPAIAAARNGYAPHSRLQVGAALRSINGRVYAGCNVENASFSVGGCAERAAIAAAVLAEGKDFRLAAITVAAFDADGTALPISPCGACRQALIEFGEDAEVSFLDGDGHWRCQTAAALMPFRFVFPTR